MLGFGRFGKAASEWGDKVRLKGASLKRSLARPQEEAGGAEAVGERGLPAGVVEGRQPSEEEQESILSSVAPGYFEESQAFDALEHELRTLPPDFSTTTLESVAEDRTAVLEVGS